MTFIIRRSRSAWLLSNGTLKLWIKRQTEALSCINCRRMSPGRNCMILSAGFRKKNSFLTVRSTTVSPNCAFLPCMSCTDHGILHSFPCAGLILIFLMSLPRKKSGILFRAVLIHLRTALFICTSLVDMGITPHIPTQNRTCAINAYGFDI